MTRDYEPREGASDDWYTPPEIFENLGLVFDLDPCSPGKGHWVPARRVYTEKENGLLRPWRGTVFMNPPFGGRNGLVPWLKKFCNHGDGIAIVPGRTSSGWFQEYGCRVDGMLFPKGKTKFIRPDGTVGSSPGAGVSLWSIGETADKALRSSGLGIYVSLAFVARRGQD